MTDPSLTQGRNADQESDRALMTNNEIMALISDWMKPRNLGEPSENSTFADAGFDSLDSAELTFYLKDKLGIEIDETVLYNHPTFAALIRYVKERL